MKCVLITVCLILLCVCLNEGKDFIAGTKANNLLISTQKLKYRSIPLIRRDKDYTYIDSKERIIKGIIARDLSRTDTEVTVTSGGVGATNVTLHFQSGRGEELNYLILIFSNNIK
ncbi:hypothetical protein SFRURICE_001885 [Spodoptera frugiperda]|uniref:SFRICE_028317 n=1 Tax=Spodoptera frugiperda TaxID=7108 RepID=A0A2H1WY35_SPOFR|nr:uncharacterized protein LOC118269918 [Spodoptera frugiperda]KAF9821774.1 hypothetical protein SFRURICE_001885 [Spodoptera frugiperda]